MSTLPPAPARGEASPCADPAPIPVDVAELAELLRLALEAARRTDGPGMLVAAWPGGWLARACVPPELDDTLVYILSPEEVRLIEARRALHARLDAPDGEA